MDLKQLLVAEFAGPRVLPWQGADGCHEYAPPRSCHNSSNRCPAALAPVYGTASGPTPPLEIPRLNSGESLYVTRPSVVHYIATTEELRRRINDIFG